MWNPFRRRRNPAHPVFDGQDLALLHRLVDDATRRAIIAQVRYQPCPTELRAAADLYAQLDTVKDKLRRLDAHGCR